MKFIDLSIPIINPEEALFDPPLTQPRIEYLETTGENRNLLVKFSVIFIFIYTYLRC